MKAAVIALCLLCTVPLAADQNSSNSRKTLTVVGQGKALTEATVVDVQLAVEVQGRDALTVQQQLASQTQPVTDFLQKAKVDKLHTGSIAVYPEYSRDNASVIVGYVGSNIISFTTTITQAGPLVDAAFKAGANRLQNLTQRADDAAIIVAKEASLKGAIQDAMRQAKSALSALGLKQKGIAKVTVAPFGGGMPNYPYAYRSLAVANHEAAPTQVLPQDQETQATVTVELDYE